MTEDLERLIPHDSEEDGNGEPANEPGNGKVILDLCGGTGSWSKPYREAGYDVEIITPPGPDVRDLLFRLDRPVHGILAAPPCTVFAASGARWKRTEAQMREALSVVDACLRAVVIYRPVWWALENPVGKLRRYLGPPTLIFNPCDFGDAWTKKTLLWGNFKIPERNPVEPVRVCSQGSWVQRLGGKSDRTKMLRSMTPPGFAEAFMKANP